MTKKIILNKAIPVVTKRKNNTLRVQQDFKNCVSLTEQHGALTTDLNYLIEKFTPDALTAYISQKNLHRREINGHDFSQEPDLQTANNAVYHLKQIFMGLDPQLKSLFQTPVDFFKFVDNPANKEKLIQMGLLTKPETQQITQIQNQLQPSPDSTLSGEKQGEAAQAPTPKS